MFTDTLFRFRKRTFRTETILWIVLEVSGTTMTSAFLSQSLSLSHTHTHTHTCTHTQGWVSLVDLIFLGKHTKRFGSAAPPATTQNATADSCTHVNQDVPTHLCSYILAKAREFCCLIGWPLICKLVLVLHVPCSNQIYNFF
jgi:hypothetical protein